MPSATPKFTITGETLDELAVSFAQAIMLSGKIAVKDNKTGTSKYGAWKLDDGTSTNPYSQGLTLNAEQALELESSAGVPQILSVDVVLRQLVPKTQIATAMAARTASKAVRLADLKAQIARLEAQVK
jgi:hypothetical protein